MAGTAKKQRKTSGRLKRRTAIAGVVCLLLPSLAAAQVPDLPPEGVPDSVRARAAGDRGFRDGLILIAFRAGATPAQKDSALARVAGRIVGGLPADDGRLDGWYVVGLGTDEGRTQDAFAAGQELAYLPWVHTWTRWDHRVEVALADLARPPTDPVGDVLTVETRTRSVWGSLAARFAPFQSEAREYRVDSSDPSQDRDPSRTWTLERPTRPPSDSASVRLAAWPDGRTELLRAPGWVGEAGVSPFHGTRLIRTEPEAFLFPFLIGPTQAAEVSGPWTDALSLGPSDSSSPGHLRGERVISFVRDSMVAGVGTLRLVRDSAEITVRRRWGMYDYGFGDTLRMSENLQGTVVGSAWLDPLGLVSSREESIVLHGTLRGELPDGRSVVVPLRYEAERVVVREDPAGVLVQSAEERVSPTGGSGAAQRREFVDLVRRLSAGDPVATDSVLTLWRAGSDPDPGQWSWLLDPIWAGRSPSAYREFLLQEGDTARWFELGIRAVEDSGGPPFSSSELEALVPFLDSPERMWAIGRSGGAVYSKLMRGLTRAIPAVTADTTAWTFTPEALELLVSWRDRASDRRLRDFATFAWFALDPGPRYDALATLARSDEATYVSRQGLRLADGVQPPGTPDQMGVPPTGAPPADWSQWLLHSSVGGRPLPSRLALFRAAHPERDLGAEVAARYREASTEEERAIFLRIAQELGESPLPDPEEIVASIAGGEPLERWAHAVRLLVDSAAAAPDSVVVALVDRLLEREVDGTPWWENLRPQDRRADAGRRWPTEHNLFLLDEGLPAKLRESWGGRIPFISQDEWEAMDPRRLAHLLRIGKVRMSGPIVYLSYSTAGRLDRAPRQGPHEYWSGTSLYLAWWAGEWWVLMPGHHWIT